MLSHINRQLGQGLKGDGVGSHASSSAPSSHSGRESLGNPKGDAILFVPATPAKKKKHLSPQQAIDEFWGKFNSKTPGRASTILPKDKVRISWETNLPLDDIPERSYARKVGDKVPKGVIKGENAVASYAEAAAICKAKVAKIVKECRRVNQKYRDPHFDIEFDLKWGTRDCLTMLGDTAGVETNFKPGSVKRVGDIFDKPEFYKGGATASDIRQGRDGDCWLMAALCTLGNKPGLIENVCVARDEEVGVYGFVFYRDGEWISEIIDDKLYLIKPDYDESWLERNLIEDRQRINSEEDYRKIYQSGSGALYFAQCEDPNETWLPLLEKAYAKAHGDYAAIEGGFTGEGLEDLTGGVTTEIFSTDILDKEYFWKEELLKVNQDFLFGCAAGLFGGFGDRKGIVEGHAYSIMRAVEIDGTRLCLIRNPWGTYEWNGPWSDGSKEWTPDWMQRLEHRFGDDGAFWISYEDLLKKYQTFDRTRLFGDDWKVTQQWTSLTVSWTSDYHSTKFSFTIEKKAPVVLVLSQLDSRYFCGLEGPYRFQLSFRVHKAGEEDYIVRSHGNYCMRRSVTAELELEPGEYSVLMKIEADKFEGCLPVEDVVRNNAKERRDKLLRIGLAYDLAHAKGQIKETEEEKKGRKKFEAKKKAKERKEIKQKLMKEKKRRKHVDNKEAKKTREANAKRKAKAKAREEKRKEKEKEEAEKRKKEEEAKKAEEEKKAKEEQIKKDGQAKKAKEEGKDVAKSESTTSETAPAIEGSKAAEPTPEQAASTTSTTEVEKKLDPTPAPAPTPASAPAPAPENKTGPPNILLNGSVPPSTGPSSMIGGPPSIGNRSGPPSMFGDNFDDDDDLSDLDSVVSDISSGVIDEAVADAKIAADSAPPPPIEDSEDEFEKDPWNAIAVVGLRVYSRESQVSVRVVRPRFWVGEGDDALKGVGQGESKLDVDDSALDATMGEGEKKEVKKEVKKEEKKEEKETKSEEKNKEEVVKVEEALKELKIEEEKKEGSQKGEEGSEGSVVMV